METENDSCIILNMTARSTISRTRLSVAHWTSFLRAGQEIAPSTRTKQVMSPDCGETTFQIMPSTPRGSVNILRAVLGRQNSFARMDGVNRYLYGIRSRDFLSSEYGDDSDLTRGDIWLQLQPNPTACMPHDSMMR